MRVLIVGHIRQCHERLRAAGHRTVLFIPRDRISRVDLPNAHGAIISLDADTSVEQWCAVAAALHGGSPFDAVACYTDKYQPLASRIARTLSVFCLIDDELISKTTNKFLMRQALDRCQVPHCRYRLARGVKQVAQAVGEIGFPCIMKPVAGQSSIGIARLDNDSDLERALRWVGDDYVESGVIVEEFLEGQEFSVEAISSGDRHHVAGLTMKYKNPVNFVEIGHVVPAPVDTAVHDTIVRYAQEVLTALGFHDTTSHTEIILTNAGPRIVETHTRLGGDHIIDLVNHACGIDLYELSARQSLGEDIACLIPETFVNTQSAAIWYACPDAHENQYVEEIRGISQAAAGENIVLVEALKNKGERGGPVRHSFDRSALAIALGATGELALSASRAAIMQLDFIYKSKAAGEEGYPAAAGS